MSRLLNIELLRFALVGGSVAVAYVVAYVLLLNLGMAVVMANAVAFGLAIVLQYFGQAVFTFRRTWSEAGQMARFATMTGLGFVVSCLITAGLAPVAGLSALQAAMIVAVWLPIQNYVLMKIWVFSNSYKGQETI